MFSSPFIEERLYLVVVNGVRYSSLKMFSSPFIEERLYLNEKDVYWDDEKEFSSPFIEERLYLFLENNRELLKEFSSPFIEERLYLITVTTYRLNH